MTNALVIDSRLAIMPVMDIGDAIARRQMFVEYVKTIMVDGTDYGTIPGASKPSLQKPGAEKLASFFGLAPTFEDVTTVEDWAGAQHGEPFFYYRQRCTLRRGDQAVAQADGSCNSWETKYRYRKADRVCPNCAQPTIMRSKYPPKDNPNAAPGWYCNAKAGGCGGSFPATDPGIVDQVVGRIPNPDPAEQVNTLLKMAQKRALVAAVLIAVNASEFFTQDIEDMVISAEYRVVDAETGEITPPTPAGKNGKLTPHIRQAQDASPAPAPSGDPLIAKWQAETKNFTHAPRPSDGQWGAVQGILSGIIGDDNRHRFYSLLFGREIASANDLSNGEAAWMHAFIRPWQDKAVDKSWHANTQAEGMIIAFMQRHPAPSPDFPAPADLHEKSAHLEEK